MAKGVTGKSESRPILENVLLRNGRLVAADGFMLVTKKADLQEGEKLGQDEEVLIPARMLEYLKPGRGDHVELELEESGSLYAVIRNDNGDAKDPSYHFLPGRGGDAKKYPDYENITLPRGEKQAVVAVGAKLLRKFLSCLPDDGVLRIGIIDSRSPVEFSIADGSGGLYRGVIMPMFTQWDEVRWLKDELGLKEEADEAPDAEHGAGETGG
jgi:hypothetical protein